MIKYLIEKEFKQMLRNSFLPKLIFIFPCMIMILMPWAANLEIKNINLNIVDNDHSVVSRRLVDKIRASTYFRLTALPATYDEALLGIEAGTADVILEIPYDFEKDWINGKAPRLLVAANAVNGTKGSLGGSYLSSIISDYSRELMSEAPVKAYDRGGRRFQRGADRGAGGRLAALGRCALCNARRRPLGDPHRGAKLDSDAPRSGRRPFCE